MSIQTISNKKKYNKRSWKPVLNFIKKVKVPYFLMAMSLIMGFVDSWFSIISPNLIKNLLDGYIDTKNIVIFLIVSILGFLLAEGSIFITKVILIKFTKSARIESWKNILKIKPSYFEKGNSSKELITRVVNDTNGLGSILQSGLDILPKIVTVIGIVLVFKKYDIMLIYVMITCALLSSFSAWLSGHIYFMFSKNMRTKLALVGAKIASIAESMPLMKIFAKEKFTNQEGNEYIDQYKKANINFGLMSSCITALNSIISIINILIVIFSGIYLMKYNRITASTFVAFFAAKSSFDSAFGGIIVQWNTIKQFHGVIFRIGELFDEEKEMLSQTLEKIEIDGDIEFKNVSFGYTKKDVLKNINFTIQKGKTTAIIGRSGSGKTTILNLLERLYEPTKGEIVINGKDIKSFSPDVWRRSISYASQNKDMFNGSIKENLVYGLNRVVDEKEILSASAKTNALSFINKKPKGFNSSVGVLGTALSGGEKQRLTLTREFLKGNNIMFFDEATASVDAESEQCIQMAMEEILEGKTAVVIAHRLSTIKKADQIILIDDGEIIGIGTHHDLYKNNSTYKHLIDIDLNQKKD